MPVIAIKCPHCGGNVQLDDDREFGFCIYCGTKIRIEDYVVNNITNNINDHKTVQINRLKELARAHIDQNNYPDAVSIIRELNEIDRSDPEGYLLSIENEYRHHYYLQNFLLEWSDNTCPLDDIYSYYDSYEKYSADRRPLVDIIKSFGLAPYNLSNELDTSANNYAKKWNGGVMYSCSNFELERKTFRDQPSKRYPGYYDYTTWAAENYKLMLNNHDYFVNVIPLLVYRELKRFGGSPSWFYYTGDFDSEEQFREKISLHSPGHLKLIDSNLIGIKLEYVELYAGNFSNTARPYNITELGRLTIFSPEGLNISPLLTPD